MFLKSQRENYNVKYVYLKQPDGSYKLLEEVQREEETKLEKKTQNEIKASKKASDLYKWRLLEDGPTSLMALSEFEKAEPERIQKARKVIEQEKRKLEKRYEHFQQDRNLIK